MFREQKKKEVNIKVSFSILVMEGEGRLEWGLGKAHRRRVQAGPMAGSSPILCRSRRCLSKE